MDVLRVLIWPLVAVTLTGCQLSYYFHSAYYQSKLINSRISIERALRMQSLTEEQKRKLKLVQEVKGFAETQLGLKRSSNYTSFVNLDEPYVTYVVQAANTYELKPYLWHFPLVGEVPYKGYFRKELAENEAKQFDPSQYDTYVRGVSAYSTLGWFQDSVLSSMLRYEDHDLVELIIHETVHTTLFVKGGVDFNERLATFMGRTGMVLFYLSKEGKSSPHLKLAAADSHDQELFSAFITTELDTLEKWYLNEKNSIDQDKKNLRLRQLQDKFNAEVAPNLLTKNYDEFAHRILNNAYLLSYKNYEFNLEDFKKLYAHFDQDYQKTMSYLMSLKQEKDPDQVLGAFVKSVTK